MTHAEFEILMVIAFHTWLLIIQVKLLFFIFQQNFFPHKDKDVDTASITTFQIDALSKKNEERLKKFDHFSQTEPNSDDGEVLILTSLCDLYYWSSSRVIFSKGQFSGGQFSRGQFF